VELAVVSWGLRDRVKHSKMGASVFWCDAAWHSSLVACRETPPVGSRPTLLHQLALLAACRRIGEALPVVVQNAQQSQSRIEDDCLVEGCKLEADDQGSSGDGAVVVWCFAMCLCDMGR
jgi:hypothetical protein